MGIDKIKKLIKKIYFKTFGRYRIIELINKEILDEWLILDAGCGRLSPLTKIKKGRHKVGLDIYEPYIQESKKLLTHDDYVLADIRNMPFESSFFDCVIAIEVLEHLKKVDGLRMLEEIERVARKKIILTTPNGFLDTYAGPKDNPKECHLSGWTCRELRKMGFKVYGLNGLKIFWKVKNGQAMHRFNIPIFSSFLIDLSDFFVYHFPSLAFQLFCVKDLNHKTNKINY